MKQQQHEGWTKKAFASLTNQQQEPVPSRDATVCARCIRQGQPADCGSPIKCAFLSGVFSSDNWNCATMNALRELAEAFCLTYRDDDSAASFGCVHSEDGYIAMTWYKNRGTTGQAIVMRDDELPRPLTLKDAEAAIALPRPWLSLKQGAL